MCWFVVNENHPSYLDVQRLNLPLLVEESYRLQDYLFPEGAQQTEVTQVAFCHNDIQENNVMVVSSRAGRNVFDAPKTFSFSDA